MDYDTPKKFKTGKQKLKEFLEKEREVVRKKEYITRSKQIKSNINDIKSNRDEVLRLSENNEKALKIYIAEINSKLYPKRDYQSNEKNIIKVHNSNLDVLTKFQDWKLEKLINSKYILEEKAKKDFEELEEKQNQKMEDEINSQLKIFHKMYKEEDKLSKIKSNFKKVGNNFDELKQENFILKIKKDLLNLEFESLNKLYEETLLLNKNCQNKIIKNIKNKKDNNTLNLKELIPYEKINENDKNYKKKHSKKNRSVSLGDTKNKNFTTNYISISSSNENFSSILYKKKTEYSFSEIANFIIEQNNKLKEIYSQIKNRNIKYISFSNNLKNLIGKCIEDLKYENKKKLKFQKQKKFDDLISKIQYESLHDQNFIDKALINLSFIYDNCFLSLIKMNSQINFSKSFKNLSKTKKLKSFSAKNLKKSSLISQSTKNIKEPRKKGQIRLFTP
jgi:hypothetical protein